MIVRMSQSYTNRSRLESGVSPKCFQFLENGNMWVDIKDSNVVSCLQKIYDGKSYSEKYTLRNNDYEVKPHPLNSKEIVQTNIETNVARTIRYKDGKSGDLSASDKNDDVLFGKSVVQMDKDEAFRWQSEYNQNQPQSFFNCLELAELAEQFSSFGSKFKYVTPDGKKCKSELYVKPLNLWVWLKMGQSRGYTHVRLVAHGGKKAEYDAIKDDPFGFNMYHAGQNGTAAGNGIYVGLSDHITTRYNKEGKDGTCILALLLTLEDPANMPVGSMKPYNCTADNTSINPNAADETRGKINALCVHETPLILVTLGWSH